MSVFNKLEREEILLGPSKKYLPINELAEEFGYAIDHLSRLCRQGRINSIRKENGRWFATRESLIEYKRKAESVKKKVAITNLGGNQIKLAPSSPLQTADTHKPGRVYLGGFSKRASRYAFLGFLILLTIFSASAFAKNKSLIGSLKNLGKSFIDFGKEFAETSFPSIKFKYDNEKLLVEIGEKKFLKFNGLKNEIDNISDNFRGFSENLGSLTLKEMNSYSANLYNQYISPVVSPIHNLISLFFGNKKESEKTNTAELEKQIQELKNQLTEAQLKISGNEKIIITQIGQGEKVTTEVVTEKRIVTLPSNVEARLLSVEQYIEQGEQKFKTMELALSGVDQRFSYTPTIIIPSGTGGNQGVTILNPATTDSETVRVSNLLDVSGSADIDGSLTLGGNFTADTNTFFVNATNNRVGVGTTNLETALEVVGTASISGQLLVGGGMSINNGSNNGAALEISGTTSTSYLIVGNSAQFANAGATVSYSRFGTSLTSHASQISTASDLLITGDLELDGNLFIDGTTNFSGYVSSSFFYAQRNTAASPSFSFGVDQDTGLFSPAANTVAFSTGGTERLRIDSNGNVGINAGNAIDTKFEVGGSASISGDLTVLGDIGIGTSSTPFQLTVAGSGSFTGQLKATRNPTLAHSGTWPSFTNANDATLYINPLSPAADGNVIVYANGSNTKFVVDTEGDVFAAGNVTLVGTTTQATTNTTGDLLVEGNARLGDATTDKIKLTGTVLPYTLTSFPILIKASASQTTDIFRILDSNDNVALTLDQGTGLLTASSGFNFALGGSTATVSYSRLGTATTGYSSNMDKFNDLLISGSLEVDGTFQVDGTASHTLAGEWNFDSNTLVIDSGTNRVGIGTTDLQTALEVAGTASISGATTLRGITYTWPSADGSSGQVLKTNGSGALSWGVGLASNSLDFDELVDSMTLDANLTINRGANPYFIGIGSAPSTVLEVQGTASASYLLTGNTLQVGGYASAAYSRFGTADTGHAGSITTTNDLLISGDLEVDASAAFDGILSFYGEIAPDGVTCSNGQILKKTGANDWDCATDSGGAASNSLDFDELVASMSLDTFTDITFGTSQLSFNLDSTGDFLIQDNGVTKFIFDDSGRLGLWTAAPSTVLEVQGTASASYLLTGNTLQVGGYSSAAYSRFGTADTGYTNFISTTNDLLISGDLEVNATAQFDSFFRISNNNTRSLVVTDTGGVYDDIFVVDTTASSTNSGLTITGGPAQTGPLLELKSSGGTVLSKFSDEGGLLVSIASISAFTVTGPDFPSASISFQINTLDSETRISALSTKSVGFEVFGIASISHTLLVGPTKFNPIASLSKFFGNGGVWVTGALCVDDGETSTTDCGDASRAAGTIYSSNVSVDIGDLAENFPTTDSSIEAGDVVMPHYLPAPADLSSESSDKYQFEFVKKSNKDGLPMGVITDKPGVLLGGLRGNPDPRSVKKVAVVLSGRVPVKVSLENGPVKEGDRLAPSSILGIAAKAIRPGIVVGIALEPITSSSLDFSVLASDSFGGTASVSYGKALSFINLSYWVPPPSEAKIDTAQKVEKGLDPLLDYLLTFIKEAFDIVFEKGIIQTVKGIFDTVEVKDGITIYDKVTDDPYCISFENGIMVTTAGICGESKSATINQTLMSTPTPTPDPTPPPTPEPTPTPTPTPDPTPESTPTPEPTPII